MIRQNQAVSLLQATHNSPVLSNLAELARDSQARLVAIQHLIPAQLRHSVLAGPIDGDSWCLLASSTAAAAKLRQQVPSLIAALTERGWTMRAIRVTVQKQAKKRP